MKINPWWIRKDRDAPIARRVDWQSTDVTTTQATMPPFGEKWGRDRDQMAAGQVQVKILADGEQETSALEVFP